MSFHSSAPKCSSVPELGSDLLNIIFKNSGLAGPATSFLDTLGKTLHSNPLSLPVDMFETADAFCVEAFLPGVPKDRINIQVKPNRSLTITAESIDHLQRDQKEALNRTENIEETRAYPIVFNAELCYGKFTRTITLPPNADITSSRTTYTDGKLRVSFAKRISEESITIEIN